MLRTYSWLHTQRSLWQDWKTVYGNGDWHVQLGLACSGKVPFLMHYLRALLRICNINSQKLFPICSTLYIVKCSDQHTVFYISGTYLQDNNLIKRNLEQKQSACLIHVKVRFFLSIEREREKERVRDRDDIPKR